MHELSVVKEIGQFFPLGWEGIWPCDFQRHADPLLGPKGNSYPHTTSCKTIYLLEEEISCTLPRLWVGGCINMYIYICIHTRSYKCLHRSNPLFMSTIVLWGNHQAYRWFWQFLLKRRIPEKNDRAQNHRVGCLFRGHPFLASGREHKGQTTFCCLGGVFCLKAHRAFVLLPSSPAPANSAANALSGGSFLVSASVYQVEARQGPWSRESNIFSALCTVPW